MNEFTVDQTNTSTLAGDLVPWVVGFFVVVVVLYLLVKLLRIYIGSIKDKRVFLQNQSFSKLVYNVSHNITGSDFEVWVKELLLSLGIDAKVVGGRGDHGIDVVANFNGKKIGIQCKKYYMKRGTLTVGEPTIRDLYGVKFADGYDKVVLITTGQFSREALTWARGKKDLILINAKLLEQIILNRGIMRELLEK
jgi:HJR/Mrr/RecB family endonuclease